MTLTNILKHVGEHNTLNFTRTVQHQQVYVVAWPRWSVNEHVCVVIRFA